LRHNFDPPVASFQGDHTLTFAHQPGFDGHLVPIIFADDKLVGAGHACSAGNRSHGDYPGEHSVHGVCEKEIRNEGSTNQSCIMAILDRGMPVERCDSGESEAQPPFDAPSKRKPPFVPSFPPAWE
jgi:hypothetical protein